MKLSTQFKFKRMAQVQELKEKEEEYDEGPKGDFEGQEDEDLKNKEKVTVPVVRRPRQYQEPQERRTTLNWHGVITSQS